MADDTGPKHDDSDRALDKLAFQEQSAAKQHFDPAEVRKHDDVGKDRLFEGREQHDDADLQSEKNRLARDVQRHHHDVDRQEADSGSPQDAKHKG